MLVPLPRATVPAPESPFIVVLAPLTSNTADAATDTPLLELKAKDDPDFKLPPDTVVGPV